MLFVVVVGLLRASNFWLRDHNKQKKMLKSLNEIALLLAIPLEIPPKYSCLFLAKLTKYVGTW
jgi:hypothetical protein